MSSSGKLPRDIGGWLLAKRLERLGYVVERQRSSHIRLHSEACGGHKLTIPDHQPIKPGTLAAILRDVARHCGLQREEVHGILFGGKR
jgi:predicted RNA binding protein YcfA (HicA-like mRNA interferase family)